MESIDDIKKKISGDARRTLEQLDQINHPEKFCHICKERLGTCGHPIIMK